MRSQAHSGVTQLVATAIGSWLVAFAAVWALWFVAGLFGVPAHGVAPSGSVVVFSWQVLLGMSAGLTAVAAGAAWLCTRLGLNRHFFLMIGIGAALAASAFALFRPANLGVPARLVQALGYYILYLAVIPVVSRTLPS